MCSFFTTFPPLCHSKFLALTIAKYEKHWRERENLALFNFLTLSTLKKFSSAAFGQSFSTEVLD